MKEELKHEAGSGSGGSHCSAFTFRIGQTYETRSGDMVKVIGRTRSKGYECLICSDGKYRYDRSTSKSDAGRVTGTPHDYSCPDNFKRPNNLLTEQEHEIMTHTLGLNRSLSAFRNHFVTGEGSIDYPICERLVASGFMTKRAGNVLSGGDDIYSVTDAGRAALKG